MRKLTRTLASLLTIFALTVSVSTGHQAINQNVIRQDVIGQARSAYYSVTKKGFKGFTATLEPNWEVILAHTATPKNLKVFRAVRFSMVVDASGAVTVRHEVGANAAKPELQPVAEKIHNDVQRLVAGFFNTWRMFMVDSPFPETENQIKIENPGKQYRLFYTMPSGAMMILMTGDFLITEWNLSSPRVKRTVKPQFQKTVDGFLLTGYQGVVEPIGDGIKTTLDFNIEYQDVGGMKLPLKVRLSGMHGSEPVEAELVFRVNGE
jgi:hypothetical protein